MNNRGLEDIIEKHWRNMETCLFSFETLTGITGDASQDNVSDISVPADQVGIAPFGSSTVQCSMDNSVGLIDFQPSFQAQCRPKISSLTAQSWKRNLTSKPDTTKHSKHRSKIGLLLPEQYMKEAYCQLEINYRFKPHLMEAQMHALLLWLSSHMIKFGLSMSKSNLKFLHMSLVAHKFQESQILQSFTVIVIRLPPLVLWTWLVGHIRATLVLRFRPLNGTQFLELSI
jgi:hypothetical protein